MMRASVPLDNAQPMRPPAAHALLSHLGFPQLFASPLSQDRHKFCRGSIDEKLTFVKFYRLRDPNFPLATFGVPGSCSLFAPRFCTWKFFLDRARRDTERLRRSRISRPKMSLNLRSDAAGLCLDEKKASHTESAVRPLIGIAPSKRNNRRVSHHSLPPQFSIVSRHGLMPCDRDPSNSISSASGPVAALVACSAPPAVRGSQI